MPQVLQLASCLEVVSTYLTKNRLCLACKGRLTKEGLKVVPCRGMNLVCVSSCRVLEPLSIPLAVSNLRPYGSCILRKGSFGIYERLCMIAVCKVYILARKN